MKKIKNLIKNKKNKNKVVKIYTLDKNNFVDTLNFILSTPTN